MEIKWFKGADREAVAFQCGANGIKLLKLATFFDLKPITLQLNGVVVEPDSNGYVLLNGADFLNGLGGSSDDAIPVAGKPAVASTPTAAPPAPLPPTWMPTGAAAATAAAEVANLKRKRDDLRDKLIEKANKPAESSSDGSQYERLKFCYEQANELVKQQESLYPGTMIVSAAASGVSGRFVNEDVVEVAREAVFLIMPPAPPPQPDDHSSGINAVASPEQRQHDEAQAVIVQQTPGHDIAQVQEGQGGSPGGAAGSNHYPAASSSSDTHGQTGKVAESVGFFYCSRYALTAEHCVRHHGVGTDRAVVGEIPKSATGQGKQRLMFKVVFADSEADIAVLELQHGVCMKWLKPYQGGAASLPSAVLTLSTYNIALLQDLPKFNTTLSFWPAAGVSLARSVLSMQWPTCWSRCQPLCHHVAPQRHPRSTDFAGLLLDQSWVHPHP